MKKFIILAVMMLGLSGVAEARNATPTIDVLKSTHTCYAVSISSDLAHSTTDATPLINVSTHTLMQFVSVLNEDSTLNLSCSERINMTATGAGRGLKVEPGQFVLWVLKAGMQWYCFNDGSAGSTNSVVCRGR